MNRFMTVMFVAAIGTALTVPAIAGDTLKEKAKHAAQSMKDGAVKAEDKVEEKAILAKDRMLGRGKQQQVMAAQQALKDKGHDPGTIDGRMGQNTRAAVHSFQKAEGLTDTGRLDRETRAKLGV